MTTAGDRSVRPILGGIQVQYDGPDTPLEATLGLVVAPHGLFVTAGHAVGGPGTLVGQPAPVIGTVESNHLDEGVDIALVKIAVGVPSTPNMIWTGANSTQAVTFESATRPKKGGVLWLQGAVSGRVQCTVHIADADVTEPTTKQKVSHVALLILTKQTQNGDSGAPVVGEDNKCYGVYGGRVVVDGETYGWFSPFDSITWG